MKIIGNEQGFSFTEVILSMLIISIALIPMMNMFSVCGENYHYSTETTTALNLAQEKIEELKHLKAGEILSDPSAWLELADAPSFKYQVEKTIVDLAQGLYKLDVRVLYNLRGQEKQISLSTYSSNR